MRTTIGGIEFELAFTVEAQKKVEEKYGGMDKHYIEQIFDTTERGKLFDNMMFMAATLINAGNHRETVRKMTMGERYDPKEPITPERLECLVTPGEVPEIERAIILAMKEGNKITIEVEPEKTKNAEATRSE